MTLTRWRWFLENEKMMKVWSETGYSTDISNQCFSTLLVTDIHSKREGYAFQKNAFRSCIWGTRQKRLLLKSERNEAGTEASKIKETGKETGSSILCFFCIKYKDKCKIFHKSFVAFLFYCLFNWKWVINSKISPYFLSFFLSFFFFFWRLL